MKKIMLIFGTRPEAIKMSPIIKELRRYPNKTKSVVVISAQHRQMLDQILDLFDIEANYDLDIMRDSQTLSDIVSHCSIGFEKILKKEKPDIVLVQGDTTTSFIASLSAYFFKISVGHIEAGLRTYNKYSPFPKEINRRLISPIADYNFAPTKNAASNLLRENISRKKIFVMGNTVIDALLAVARQNFSIKNIKDKELAAKISKINFQKKIILVTAHRRENFGKPFESICLAIKEIVKRNKQVEIVYPVHLNPNVQEPVKRILKDVDRLHLIAPLDYEILVQIMDKSYMVLTDSGGIQEEAPSLGKPVLVMRNDTERVEAISAGTAKLVGTNKDLIIKETEALLSDKNEYEKMSKAINPYGDGKTAKRIVNCLLNLPFMEFNPGVK